MRKNRVQLDLRGLSLEQEVAALREQYRLLRGTGGEARALVEERPARLYISMLERGYRVALERKNGQTVLILRPDGSTPRLGIRGAHSVAGHPDGRIYTNTTQNRVAVIEASSRKLLRHIPVGQDPSHLELSRDARRLYVANAGSNDVTIIDTATDAVINPAPTGKRPLRPCVAPDGKRVYLPSGPDRSVTVLGSEGSWIKKLSVGEAPHDMGVSPDCRWGYQPNSGSHTVSMIDIREQSVIGEIRVGLGPGHVTFSPDSRRAYVANTLSDDVSVIDTSCHEIVATIPAGVAAHLPILSHDGKFGYVANFASDDLTVWDTRSERVVTRIPVGIYPHFFAISPDDRWIVVSNTGESSVCLVHAKSHSTRAQLHVGGAPAHLAFDPEGRLAFIGCEISDEVAVIDLAKQRVLELVKAGALRS